MDENNQQKFLVPFGKYKGQPLQVLENDESYANWVINQENIKQRYPIVYNFIVHNQKLTPIDTPEHNKMQVRFLDWEYSLKLIYLLDPNFFKFNSNHFKNNLKQLYFSIKNNDDKLEDFGGTDLKRFNEKIDDIIKYPIDLLNHWETSFEVKGSDVFVSMSYGYDFGIFFRNYDIYDYGDYITKRQKSLLKQLEFYINTDLKIELKPSIGDDFPSVFREMKSHKSNILIIDQLNTTNVSFDILEQFFSTEGIRVIFESKILGINLPIYDEKIIFDKNLISIWDKEFQEKNG